MAKGCTISGNVVSSGKNGSKSRLHCARLNSSLSNLDMLHNADGNTYGEEIDTESGYGSQNTSPESDPGAEDVFDVDQLLDEPIRDPLEDGSHDLGKNVNDESCESPLLREMSQKFDETHPHQEEFNCSGAFTNRTRQIVHDYIKNIKTDPTVKDLKELTARMRDDAPTHFQNFVNKLEQTLVSSRSGQPNKWLSLSFTDLTKQVGQNKKWVTVGKLFNCIWIVLETAKKVSGHQGFNIDMSRNYFITL
jgi:hypothetical protein